MSVENDPGTKPDFYSSREMSKDVEANRAAFREMADQMKQNGAKWARFTVDETFGYLWAEGWREPPQKEAPFDPPYVLADERPAPGKEASRD